MNRATEGNPTFVARSPDGNTIPKEWTTRMCQLLAKKPGEKGKGKPLLRSEVLPRYDPPRGPMAVCRGRVGKVVACLEWEALSA